MIKNAIVAILIATTFLLPTQSALAFPPDDKFIRTAIPFMKLVEPANYDSLSKFDLVILPAELQISQPHIFAELRQRNAEIVLLAYMPTKSYILGWGDQLHLDEKSGIDESYWLRDTNGSPVSVWPGTHALSATSGWNTYLPHFVHDRVLSTGLWDGIFYDEVSDTISWVNGGNVTVTDTAWKAGMTTMLTTARALDPEKIFVINGTSTPEFQPVVNGRMFESFPTPWEANGNWYEIMRRYLVSETVVGKPATFIINANTANTGNQNDYKKMRFGLTSTLLGNGFYSFDYGDQDHGQTWTYDEYAAYLGKPAGSPELATNALTKADGTNGYRLSAGVWQRDYQNGIALVNPTEVAQTIIFDSEYEKIRGSQDTKTNDGSIVSSVTLPAKDGLVMLRPLDKIANAPYLNGSFVRIMNETGVATRTGFFAYDSRFRGSTIIIENDIDNNGIVETLVADKTTVKIFNGNNEQLSFYPFDDKWKNGMEIAIGDINNDGKNEIVVGAGSGGVPQVKIFNLIGKEIGSFLAYNKNFRGGVHLAVGNTDGKNGDEIITGAGSGGGPHVRVWNEKGIIKTQFFAYTNSFTGGVYVAAGDVLGLGHEQVVTGAGFGGGPQVRIFDAGNKNKVVGSFFAYNKNLRTGVRVSASDLNGDGKAEILGQSTDVFTVASTKAPAVQNPNPLEETNQAISDNDQSPTEIINPDIPERPLFLGMDI